MKMNGHHGVVNYQRSETGYIGAGRRVGQTRSTGQGVDVVNGVQGPERTGPWFGTPAQGGKPSKKKKMHYSSH